MLPITKATRRRPSTLVLCHTWPPSSDVIPPATPIPAAPTGGGHEVWREGQSRVGRQLMARDLALNAVKAALMELLGGIRYMGGGSGEAVLCGRATDFEV